MAVVPHRVYHTVCEIRNSMWYTMHTAYRTQLSCTNFAHCPGSLRSTLSGYSSPPSPPISMPMFPQVPKTETLFSSSFKHSHFEPPHIQIQLRHSNATEHRMFCRKGIKIPRRQLYGTVNGSGLSNPIMSRQATKFVCSFALSGTNKSDPRDLNKGSSLPASH